MIQQSHFWAYIRKKQKLFNSKTHMHPNVHSSTIYNSQDMETTQMAINRWHRWQQNRWQLKKMWCIYIYTIEYYLAIKKNETLPFTATWMDPENIIPSEISQSEENKYYLISLICGI